MPQLLFRGLFDAESTPNEEIVVAHKLIDVNSFREIYQLAWEGDADYNQSLALDAYRLFNSVLLVHAKESIRKSDFVPNWPVIEARMARRKPGDDSRRRFSLDSLTWPVTSPETNEFYARFVHPLVLNWLEETDFQALLRSDEVAAIDETFGGLYAKEAESHAFVLTRELTQLDAQNICKLLRLLHPRMSTELQIELDKVPPSLDSIEWLQHIAHTRILRRAARSLPPNAAQAFLSMVQDASIKLADESPMLVKLLQDVSYATHSFPAFARAVVAPGPQKSRIRSPFARGSEAELIKTTLGIHGQPVVVKSPRFQTGSQSPVTRFERYKVRLLLIWYHLSKREIPNIVPLLGVSYNEEKTLEYRLNPVMPEYRPADEWFCEAPLLHGRAIPYIGLGIAAGLAALHSRNIIHGDLHWKNVLIVPNPWGIPSNQVRPLLCDFGMARLQHASNQNSLTMFPLISLKAEFTAPEVIDWAGKEVRPTKAGDVFSFAKTMLAFALLSDPKKGPIEGEGNGFPPRLWAFGYTQTPDLWRLMKDMTQKDPEKRPKMVKEFGNADGEDGVALVETRMRNEVLWENPYYRLPAQP